MTPSKLSGIWPDQSGASRNSSEEVFPLDLLGVNFAHMYVGIGRKKGNQTWKKLGSLDP
jgi:hypothetical protein